jgi:alkanesulfonate monooxygenase SsuD/methylene tetrahydromethanopterin reductase-like flavin-dependent oxidoreductase (luciferase family)
MRERSLVALERPQLDQQWHIGLLELLADLEAQGVDTLLLQSPRNHQGALDPFVVLGAVAESTPLRLGVILELGQGRAVSIAVREVTSLDHLCTGGVLLGFESDAHEHLRQALAVAFGLLSGESATAGGDFEHVVDAPNLPGPRRPIELLTLSTEAELQSDGTVTALALARHHSSLNQFGPGLTIVEGLVLGGVAQP